MKNSEAPTLHSIKKQPYTKRVTMRSVMRRLMKIPVFVPPIFIFVNLYLILHYDNRPVEDPQLAVGALPRDKRQAMDLNAQHNIPKTNDVILQQQMVNNRRIRHVSSQCAKYANDKGFWEKKMLGHVLATPDMSLIYCDVPKVGCTYWKQVFRYLTHDYEGIVTGPEAIPRVYAHYGPWNHTKILELKINGTIEQINKSGLKFMIARDPFARLWSGYLDKLFLPDFWWWFGPKVIEKIRPNADPESKRCGHDVTFSEFLEFIVDKLKNGGMVDQHFEPSYSRCNPCKIHFDIIGKMETFSADSKLVLSYTDIEHVNAQNRIRKESEHEHENNAPKINQQKKPTVTVDRAIEEMKMLTIYNFDNQAQWIEKGKNADCYNQAEIGHRIWKTFQYNGYLGDDIEYPYEEIQNIQNKDLIKQYILDKLTASRRNATPDVLKSWSKQRDMYLRKAYENVPKHIIEGVREVYKKDFELFQYDSKPSHIFKSDTILGNLLNW